MRIFALLKEKIRMLKQQTLVVYFAARDPRTPLFVRLLALATAAYALSPIDLIPDFVPFLGYVDDLFFVTLGFALVIWLTPEEVIESARLKAAQVSDKVVSYAAAAVIVTVWSLLLWFGVSWFIK
ncbi:MAG: DUF1232 domain-containing protein [Nitrospiraceae bacterium]|nr:DUF1232 domain-containing protein [Nitrospiraceae bacterium]